MNLGDAIRDRINQQEQDAAAAAPAWQDDPELEEKGRRLDLLKEHDPASHQDPGLGYVRQEVANYRRQKADALHNQQTNGRNRK